MMITNYDTCCMWCFVVSFEAMMSRASAVPGVLDRIENLPAEWTVASTCTGSGTFETALHGVASAMAFHLPLESDYSFTDTCMEISERHHSILMVAVVVLFMFIMLKCNCSWWLFQNGVVDVSEKKNRCLWYDMVNVGEIVDLLT